MMSIPSKTHQIPFMKRLTPHPKITFSLTWSRKKAHRSSLKLQSRPSSLFGQKLHRQPTNHLLRPHESKHNCNTQYRLVHNQYNMVTCAALRGETELSHGLLLRLRMLGFLERCDLEEKLNPSGSTSTTLECYPPTRVTLHPVDLDTLSTGILCQEDCMECIPRQIPKKLKRSDNFYDNAVNWMKQEVHKERHLIVTSGSGLTRK